MAAAGPSRQVQQRYPGPFKVEQIVFLPPPIVTDPGFDQYKVERILSRRRKGRGFQYLIKWDGYPEHEASWEPACNISPDLIEELMRNTTR